MNNEIEREQEAIAYEIEKGKQSGQIVEESEDGEYKRIVSWKLIFDVKELEA